MQWIIDEENPWMANADSFLVENGPGPITKANVESERDAGVGMTPDQVIEAAREQIRSAHERVTEEAGKLRASRNQLSASLTDDQMRRIERTIGATLDYQQVVRYGQVDQYRGEGDVEGGLSGLANLSGVSSIQCVHADQGIRRLVNDIIEHGEVPRMLRQLANTLVFYGQVTHGQMWDHDSYNGTVIFNPKHTPISQYMGISERDAILRPPNSLEEFLRNKPTQFHRLLMQEWDEYMQLELSAVPLDPDMTAVAKESDLPFIRYTKPRISSAVRPLSYRAALDEMRMGTVEGVTNQMTLYKVKDPARGELTRLQQVVNATKAERTKSFVWRDSLTIEQYHPKSIGELLTDDSIVRATADVFRHLRIGVELTGSTLAFRQMSAEQINYMIWSMLTQATWIQEKIRETWITVFVRNFNKVIGWRKRQLSIKDFIFVPTALNIAYTIRNIVQPLATYGIISVEGAMRMSGLDYEKEINRIRDEWASGTRQMIMPMSSFSQTVQRPDGGSDETQSISQPGRTPDRANPNIA
ncbi:hypothetical protein Rctr71_097 [Virus Rctr71]|nr:hypothetical protein Rctr71_097 [Virus Rctr71]